MNRIITAAMAAAVLAAPAIADAPGFFKIPGTETTMKISGKVEVDGVYTFTPSNGNTGSFSNDGEGTSSLPSWEDSGPDGQWDLSSIGRINVQTLTPTKYGDLLARVEIQGGGQNGATVKLRHAYVNMAGWTIGLTNSNFADTAAGAGFDCYETVYGAPNNAQTLRFSQITKRFDFGKEANLSIGIEQESTDGSGWFTYDQPTAPPPADDDSNPDVPDHAFPGAVTAAFNWNPSWGHIGVRALYQQWSGWGYNDATNTQDDWNEGAFAWQVGCNIPVFGKDTIIASVYGGEGMGAYGMGMTGRASIEPGSGYGDAYLMEEMGFALGYTHVWNDTWRSNLIVSQVSRDEDEDEGVAGPAVIENYQQVILNTYWNVTPTMELGMEYSYGIVNFFEDTPNPYQPGSTDENPTQHAIYLSLTTQFF